MYLPFILSILCCFSAMKFGIVHGYKVSGLLHSLQVYRAGFQCKHPMLAVLGNVDVYGKIRESASSLGHSPGHSPGHSLGHSPEPISPKYRTSLREALDLRIADFKGCELLPLLLLLFEKPSTFCRRRLTPEIEFSNSFRGL